MSDNRRVIHAEPTKELFIYPSSVTFRKHLPFLNSRAFVYEAIASFFSNNKYSHQVFLIE
jgi:hypothetical protein